MADARGSSGCADDGDSAKKKLEKKYEDLTVELKASYEKLRKASKKEKKKSRPRGRLGLGLGPASGGPESGSSVKPVAFYGVADGDTKRLEYNSKQRQWYAARKEKPQRSAGPVEEGEETTAADENSSDDVIDNNDDDLMMVDERFQEQGYNEEGVHLIKTTEQCTKKDYLENELASLIAECEEILVSAKETEEKSRTWKNRMDALEESWSDRRAKLFEFVLECETPSSSICEICCKKDSTIQCEDCDNGNCICEDCDKEIHFCKPLHNRKIYKNGFLQRIAPNKSVHAGFTELIEKEMYLNLKPRRCHSCDEAIQKTLAQIDPVTAFKCIVVTMKGRYDLLIPNVLCHNCGHSNCALTARTIIQNNFWPCSVDNITSIIHTDVFKFWNAFQKLQPNSAESCFLRVLEDISEQCSRVSSINRSTFARAFKEWKYCSYELDSMQMKNWMVCPPCHITQHSVHVDGNSKLKRFQRAGSGVSKCYYGGHYIIPKEDVEAHVTSIGSSNRAVVKDNTCGNSVWEAASNVARRKAQLDETGLYLSSCRHQVTQKALNMYRGEIYAYPLLLQHHFLKPTPVMFFWQDVICKYWPWLKHVNEELANAMKPALSVMHGKGHAWHCEVIYGGRWVEGTALANGEEVEQVNSYLSRAAHITKRMLPENREELLTECAQAWNKRKVENMPNQLSLRFIRTRKSVVKLKEELSKICEDSNVSDDQIDFSQWKNEIQQIALAESSKITEVDMTKTEDYVLNVAELHSIGKLPESISICDGGILRKLAWECTMSPKCLTKNKSLDEKKNLCLSFFAKLNSTEDNHRQLLESSVLGIRLKLGKVFQREIEKSYLSIFQMSSNARRLTDSCKGFVKIVKKCKKEKEALKPKVDAYNSIAIDCKLPVVKFEEVCIGNMPWYDDQLTPGPSVKVKRAIIEKLLQIRRSEEELPLLVREMRDHVLYYKRHVLPQLEATEDKMLQQVQDIARWGIAGHSPQSTHDASRPEQKGRYQAKDKNMHICKGIISVLRKGKHFAQSQIDQAAMKFKKIFEQSSDGGMSEEIEAVGQNLLEVFDDSEDDEEQDEISSSPIEITTGACTAGQRHQFSEEIYILERIEDFDIELLLLSEEISSTCHKGENSTGACIFHALILAYYFVQSEYRIYHLYCRMGVLVSQICEGMIEGDRVYSFFTEAVPQFTASVTEAATLLLECNLRCSIAFETVVFLENPDDEKLLFFQLERLLSLKKRYAVIYTYGGYASMFLLDGNTILFIDTHANSVDSVQGGTILIRAKESLRAFIREVAKVRNIDPCIRGDIAVVTC